MPDIINILNTVAPNVQAFLERIRESDSAWDKALSEERIFLDESAVITECKTAVKAIVDWHESERTEPSYQWAANNLNMYQELPKDLGLLSAEICL